MPTSSTQRLAHMQPGPPAIAPGTWLGPYEVQDFIGSGAMGVVYRAYHAQLERTGAVKVLQGIGPDPESNARFRREAQAIAHMRHPNILNVYDFGEYQGLPYMILEFVPGGSLAARIQEGPVDQKSAIALLKGIAEGLDYAHSLGIVHRDVKPANVLLGPEGAPILADFGLAKLMESTSIKSITGMTTGTPAYMAPEQVNGSEVGPAADRYSLATIAYELLTGAFPFEGESLMGMLYAHVNREPPPPSSIKPELGPAVDAVILRGLAKAPEDRWPSCEAFVAALDAALKRPVNVERTVAVASVAIPAVQPAVAPLNAAEKRSNRRNYAIGSLLAIAVLVIAGFCGYSALTGTTLAVSPVTVHPGDEVTVTAGHVPANQTGEIQLRSVLHTFPFRSDGKGNVRSPLTIPSDTPIGDHTVSICWNGACHAQTILHVIGSGALGPATTPSSSQSPNASPRPTGSPTAPATSTPGGGSKPVGGSSPAPNPGPSPRPSPIPSPIPSPHPSPIPSPTPSPRPSPVVPPSISLSSSHIRLLTGSVTVYGLHFGGGASVTITFTQGITGQTYAVTAGSDGSFARVISVPATALVGQATITACNASNACASQAITVTLT